jgi:hypothetical protein
LAASYNQGLGSQNFRGAVNIRIPSTAPLAMGLGQRMRANSPGSQLPVARAGADLGARNFNSMMGQASPDVTAANDTAIARQRTIAANPMMHLAGSSQAGLAGRMARLAAARRPVGGGGGYEPPDPFAGGDGPILQSPRFNSPNSVRARVSSPTAAPFTVQRPMMDAASPSNYKAGDKHNHVSHGGGSFNMNVVDLPAEVIAGYRNRSNAKAAARTDAGRQNMMARATLRQYLANPAAAGAFGDVPAMAAGGGFGGGSRGGYGAAGMADVMRKRQDDLMLHTGAYHVAMQKGELPPGLTLQQYLGATAGIGAMGGQQMPVGGALPRNMQFPVAQPFPIAEPASVTMKRKAQQAAAVRAANAAGYFNDQPPAWSQGMGFGF